MNESFLEYINNLNPNDENIEVATRAFISDISNDLLPEEMKDKLLEYASVEVLDKTIIDLQESPQARRDACLTFLSKAWEDSTNREKIKAAFVGSSSKLPAIELGILAVVSMYAMYLIITGGKKKETHIIKKNKDGTYEEKKITEYEDPVGPISIITKFFSFGSGKDKNKSED